MNQSMGFEEMCTQCGRIANGLMPYGKNGEEICITCGGEDAERCALIVVSGAVGKLMDDHHALTMEEALDIVDEEFIQENIWLLQKMGVLHAKERENFLAKSN